MRPRRYPYSGKVKKPIEQATDLLKRISRLEFQVINLANHEMFKMPSSRSSTT